MDTPRSTLRELNEVGRVGRLAITFVPKRGRTVIGDCFSEIPHKITRPYYAGDSPLAQLILMNSTAGLFGGDRTDIEIHVARGAQAMVTTQASTKVHPSPEGSLAEQRIRLSVECDAELHLYNDPLIPFAGSRLKQRIEIHLAKGARFYFWDGFVAGRVERGETWQFLEFDSETRMERNGRPIYLDRFRLEPANVPPSSHWAMSDLNYLATGLFFDDRLQPDSIQAAVPETGVDQPTGSLIVVRTVAHDGAAFRDLERRVLKAVFAQRGEKVPELRKN